MTQKGNAKALAEEHVQFRKTERVDQGFLQTKNTGLFAANRAQAIERATLKHS